MRENTAKHAWREGNVTFGAWLSVPSAFSAEVMAHQGFDWLCIDMQHGVIDYQTAVAMLQAIGATPTVPFVRVPWNEPGVIGKVLDAGAYGVIIPMVNSVAEAQQAVASCRYAPAGFRSYGPTRAAFYAGSDYFAHANDEIACIPMIETKQAVEQLDDILSVPGIDAVYVGPADLSITLGLPPAMWHDDERFLNARRAIVDGCKRHNVCAGIHSSAQIAPKHVEAGFQMITISSDVGSIASGAARDLRTMRGGDTASGQPVYR